MTGEFEQRPKKLSRMEHQRIWLFAGSLDQMTSDLKKGLSYTSKVWEEQNRRQLQEGNKRMWGGGLLLSDVGVLP